MSKLVAPLSLESELSEEADDVHFLEDGFNAEARGLGLSSSKGSGSGSGSSRDLLCPLRGFDCMVERSLAAIIVNNWCVVVVPLVARWVVLLGVRRTHMNKSVDNFHQFAAKSPRGFSTARGWRKGRSFIILRGKLSFEFILEKAIIVLSDGNASGRDNEITKTTIAPDMDNCPDVVLDQHENKFLSPSHYSHSLAKNVSSYDDAWSDYMPSESYHRQRSMH